MNWKKAELLNTYSITRKQWLEHFPAKAVAPLTKNEKPPNTELGMRNVVWKMEAKID